MRDASDPQVYADWLRTYTDAARRDPPEETRRLATLDWHHQKNRPAEWLLAGFFFGRYLQVRGLPAEEVFRIARWYADAPNEDCRRGLGSIFAAVRDWPAFVELMRLGLGLPDAPASEVAQAAEHAEVEQLRALESVAREVWPHLQASAMSGQHVPIAMLGGALDALDATRSPRREIAEEVVTGFPVRFESGRLIDVDTGAEVVRLEVSPSVYGAALDAHMSRGLGGDRTVATFCGRVLSRTPAGAPEVRP